MQTKTVSLRANKVSVAIHLEMDCFVVALLLLAKTDNFSR